MNSAFLPHFQDPYSGEDLVFFEFEKDVENLISGIFINLKSGASYPLFNGVPVFLNNAISSSFLEKHKHGLAEIQVVHPHLKFTAHHSGNSWSFSSEWESHKELGLGTTWGMTAESRYKQFLLETKSEENQLARKIMLDAGCGNGMLTERISEKGCAIFGIDFSTSVFQAEERRNSPTCCFVQGDLQHLPFRDNHLDIVVSNGVIHHTPNTEFTFKQISKKIKNEGKFYIWLYSQKGSTLWKIKRLFFDFLRIIISRMPDFIQKFAVGVMTLLIFTGYKLAGKKLDKQTLHVDMYDSITPRWRHYHTPEEISRWYFENGFGPISLTHWDNRYGFGALGVRTRLDKTPGEHFSE